MEIYKKALHCAICFLILNNVNIATAQILISDNFDSYASGSTPSTTTSYWNTQTSGTGLSYTSTVDAGNLFGEGTSNQFLKLTDAGAFAPQCGSNNIAGATSVISASFDVYEPTDSTNSFVLLNFYNAAADLYQVRITNGTLQLIGASSVTKSSVFSTNQLIHFMVVVNNSSSIVTYQDGVTTIAARSADIWVGGARIDAARAFTLGTADGVVDSFRITGSASGTQEIYIDNFKYEVGAVPEARTCIYLAMCCVFLLMVFRKQKKIIAHDN